MKSVLPKTAKKCNRLFNTYSYVCIGNGSNFCLTNAKSAFQPKKQDNTEGYPYKLKVNVNGHKQQLTGVRDPKR